MSSAATPMPAIGSKAAFGAHRRGSFAARRAPPIAPRPCPPQPALASLTLTSYHYSCNGMRCNFMATVVTINRPDVVALIEEASRKLTDGNKTEAVALAVRRLLEQNARAGSLFGAHRGSVRVH